MYISVNKKAVVRRPVKYAALSSGTISHVWCDDEQATASSQKRKNRILLNREQGKAKAVTADYDA